MFVTRCKFAALPLACSTSKTSQQQQQQSQQPSSQQPPSQQQQQQRHKGPLKLLLVEDLPYVGEASRRARLAAALHELATTARCPVVVVATTEEGSSSSSRAGGGYGSYGGAAAGVASSKGLHKVSWLESMWCPQVHASQWSHTPSPWGEQLSLMWCFTTSPCYSTPPMTLLCQ